MGYEEDIIRSLDNGSYNAEQPHACATSKE